MRQDFLQFELQGVGITVVWGVIWILVGIEEYMGLATCIFVAGTAVGCQAPNVRTCQFL